MIFVALVLCLVISTIATEMIYLDQSGALEINPVMVAILSSIFIALVSIAGFTTIDWMIVACCLHLLSIGSIWNRQTIH